MIELCDLATILARIEAHRGKGLLVHHFATWCGGCVEEMPRVASLQAHATALNAGFLVVTWELFMRDGTVEDAVQRVSTFCDEQGLRCPVLMYEGEPSALITALGIHSGTIPHTAIYNQDGMVTARFETPLEGEEDVARVRKALSAASQG